MHVGVLCTDLRKSFQRDMFRRSREQSKPPTSSQSSLSRISKDGHTAGTLVDYRDAQYGS